MLRRGLIGLVFAGLLAFSAAGEVVIRIGPPHIRIETRGRPPSRDHVWISGYHRWDGNAYAWNEGRWEVPPQPRQRWVAHRWVHQRNGYVLVDGHWR